MLFKDINTGDVMNEKRELTDEIILQKGYKEYSPTRFHNSSVIKCFQKRFDDNEGKRYFLDIEKWTWRDIPQEHKCKDWYKEYTYAYKCQMYKKDTHDAIDIEFHSSWTLEQVEEFMELQWNTGLYDHYEKWGE